ncbi:MAG: flagellar protein FlgN [Actinomycetota bacterium]|nr:flagellar protein FlgN [Actinomycetota bacterium]
MKIDDVALVDVLRCEKESYQDLLGLAKKEQELIIGRDTEGLSEILEAIERIIVKARNLEEQRFALLGVDNDRHPPQSSHTISSVLRSLNGVSAIEACKLRDEILQIIDELSETNKTNAELVNRSIGYIDFLLDSLLPAEDPCYGSAAMPQSPRARIFDGRA